MIKYKPLYKSEYNKIIVEENEHKLNNSRESVYKKESKVYKFTSSFPMHYNYTNETVSTRIRNKNERFLNKLCTK
jgi:hypothetical protein